MALIVALMAMALMSALGMALMLMSQTETLISANYRDSMEGAVRRRCRDRARDGRRADAFRSGTRFWPRPTASRSSVTSGFVDTAPSRP